MNYGRALRIARAIAGLDQKALAARAGLDASHISLIEQSKRNPTVATLEKIAHGLALPYHLLTLLAAESKDLRNVTTEETTELGEMIARLLLTNENVDNAGQKKRRPKRRSKT